MTTPKRPRGRMTAAEHEAWLKETGQYEAMKERERLQDEERAKRVSEYRHAEEPLVDELRAAGCQVKSVWDLVNTPGSYPAAVPILFSHLQCPYPAPVREGIARALAVPEAKDAGWDVLVRLFSEEQEKRVKDGIAVAIDAAADDEVIGDVIALVSDARHGTTRVLMLDSLERSADPRAREALMSLGSDPDLTKEIQVILRRQHRRSLRKRTKR